MLAMRTTAAFLLLVTLVLTSAATASAQTVDDIVEKSLAAVGGRGALGTLTSRVMTGKIVVTTPGGDIPGTITVMNQAPNKVRTLMALDLASLGAGTMEIDYRFDGTTGFVLDSMRGDREVTGGQLETLRNTVFPSPFLDYKERGTTIALAGTQKVGDVEALALTITPKSGPATRLLLDSKTYLPLRTITMIDVPEAGGNIEQTTDLSDYREVDGVKVPFHLKGTSPVQNFTVNVTKIEHTTTIDPALFAKPAGK
jgi:outer membrane lipoprotein-sorting protein